MVWPAAIAAGATALGSMYSANQNAAAQGEANEYNVNIEEARMNEAARQFYEQEIDAQEARAYDAGKYTYGEGAKQRQDTFRSGVLNPYTTAGTGATQQQMDLLGLSGQEASKAALAKFNESPGQAFLRQQQEKSVLRNASAMGGLRSGRTATALQENAFGRAQTDYGNYFNRLQGLSSLGQTSASQLATQYTGADPSLTPTYTPRELIQGEVGITRPEEKEKKYLGWSEGDLATGAMIDPISTGATYGAGKLLGGGK